MKAPRAVAISMTLCGLFAALVIGCVKCDLIHRLLSSSGRRSHGTLVTITAVVSDKDVGYQAIQVGFDEITRLERLLSTWCPDSELSRMNGEAGAVY